MQHETLRNGHANRPVDPERLELDDTVVVELAGSSADAPREQQEFDVVAIVENADSVRYAVCYCESADEFIVTDDTGALLSDEEQAQEILDDYLQQADEQAEGG